MAAFFQMPGYALNYVAHTVDCKVMGFGLFAGAAGRNHCDDFFCPQKVAEGIGGMSPFSGHVLGRMALKEYFGLGHVVRLP